MKTTVQKYKELLKIKKEIKILKSIENQLRKNLKTGGNTL